MVNSKPFDVSISFSVMGRVLSRFTPGALAVFPVYSAAGDSGIKRSVRRGAPEPRHPPPIKNGAITG